MKLIDVFNEGKSLGTGDMVIDENNFLQSSEQGMSFEELAAYAGFDVNALE